MFPPPEEEDASSAFSVELCTPPTSVSVAATRGVASCSPCSSSAVLHWPPPASLALTPPPSQSPFVLDLTPPAAISPLPSASSPVSPQRIPLHIHVRKLRVLVISVATVALLVTCIELLHRGVVVSRGGTRFDDDRVRRTREDDLNFYVGTGVALLAKVFEVAAVFVLPIVVLLLMTERSMLNDSFYWRLGVLLMQGIFIALLTNGFSTTYVTSRGPVVVERFMTERDVVNDAPSVASNGLDLFTTSNASTVPRRAVSDTMLRTAILPPYARPLSRSKCTAGPTNHSLAIRFGFYSSDWLRQLAPRGVQLDASVNVSVRDWLGPPTPPPPTMPYNLTVAANLAIHAIQLLVDRLRMPLLSASTVNPLQVYARQATIANQASDATAFLRVTAAMLNNSLLPQDEFGFFFAPRRASIQFATHTQGSVSLDTLTLTLPFREGIMQRSLVATQFDTLRDDTRFDPQLNGDLLDANGDRVYQVFPTEECGTRGCWLAKPTNSPEADAVWNMRPEVVVYSRCRATFESIGSSELDFTACTPDKIVNHSLVVGAIGSTLLADRFVEYETSGFTPRSARIRRANVTNLRRTMSLTVGVLSWRVADLSKVYGVRCAPNTTTNCAGLWYPLSSRRDVLVDSHHLVADELNPIAGGLFAGQPLVSLVTDLPGGSFLALQHVQQGIEQVSREENVTHIEPAATGTVWPCSRDLEFIADSIVFNRWYIDHSLQEAYTAALVHLFQFGVNHSVAFDATAFPSKAIDLFGNVFAYQFVAHIPEKAALVSFLAGVLLLVSIAVVVCAGRRRECTIQDLTDVHRVARVHLVDQFFPKIFLKCTVFATPQGQPLEPFRIVAMRLHRQTPEGDVYVTLPTPSRPSLGVDDLSAFEPDDARGFIFQPIESVGGFYHTRPVWPEPPR